MDDSERESTFLIITSNEKIKRAWKTDRVKVFLWMPVPENLGELIYTEIFYALASL